MVRAEPAWFRWARRTLGAGSVFVAVAVADGCKKDEPPSPASLTISGVPERLQEGKVTELQVQARDALGQPMASAAVAWSAAPDGLVRMEGAVLTALRAGKVTITARAGSAHASAVVEVESPLTGTWERATHPAKGMQIRFESRGDSLVATIVRAPPVTDEETEWIAKHWNLSSVQARLYAECGAQMWTAGLGKLKDVRRVSGQLWSAEALLKSYRVLDGLCSDQGSGFERAELRLVNADTLEYASLVSKNKRRGDVQIWRRVEPATPRK
jgi:hypothetical protein